MDEQLSNQIADTATRLASAAEALEKALDRLQAQQEAIQQKVERIVAAIDDHAAEGTSGLQDRAAQLERENQELKAQAQQAARKTLSPLVSALLTKSGIEEREMRIDASALDRALGSLTLEQRIAVKAEMARAGMLE
jgi:seryl-tRNA synthetase